MKKFYQIGETKEDKSLFCWVHAAGLSEPSFTFFLTENLIF